MSDSVHNNNNNINDSREDIDLILSAASPMQERLNEIDAHSVKHLESPAARKKLAEVLENVQNDLTSVLDKCGFYYRLNSRVKSVPSLTKKLSSTNPDGSFKYTSDHLLQDLFGFRILIYFIEDLSILKKLLKQHYECVDDWTKVSYNAQEFQAISTNGVFRLNKTYSEKINNLLGGKYIDNTFEIQLRTVSFDGWHEIEHDYSYKYNNMWQDQGEYLRRFHSVLATLELCDDTMVTTLENLAYDIYARKRHPDRYAGWNEVYGNVTNNDTKRSTLCDWDRMIRAHFRLRINHVVNSASPDQELIQPLLNLFESEDISAQKDAYKFAKYVLRFRKETLIQLLYLPKNFLDSIRKEAIKKYSGKDNKAMNQKPIWDNYNFRKRISIDVNSIVVLIMLYKEAREASLTEQQRALLANSSIKRLVSYDSKENMNSIINEESILLSLPKINPLNPGDWNTIHKNELMLTTGYTESVWKKEFINIIISDMKTLFANAKIIPRKEDIIKAIDESGEFRFISEEDRAFHFTIKCTDDSIISAIEYPGLYMENNSWRQIIEFTEAPSVVVFGANGISIKVKLCIQNKLPDNIKETALPAISEPNILQVVRSFTKNTAYVIKPYIGQKKEHKNTGKHYMDITYVKRISVDDTDTIPADDNYIYAISKYFAAAVSTRSNIHPIVLFLFDKIDDLYKYETQLAIFESSLGGIAYVYAGIIEDADKDIFQNDSSSDDEQYVPLNAIGVKGSGVYIFRQSITPQEEPDSFMSCIAANSIEEIDRYEYTNIINYNHKKSETLHGLYALTEQLRHELRKYNLLVESKSIDEITLKFNDIF